MPASFFARLFWGHSKAGVPGVPDDKTPMFQQHRDRVGGTPSRTPGVPGVPAAVSAWVGSADAAGRRAPLSATLAELRRDEFEERAAILEYEGGLSRAGAERVAYIAVYGLAAASRRAG